jgi:hypothetical protein
MRDQIYCWRCPVWLTFWNKNIFYRSLHSLTPMHICSVHGANMEHYVAQFFICAPIRYVGICRGTQGRVLYKYDHVFTSRVTSEKQVFLFIRLKSKEKISAISARKKFQIDEELVVFVQYASLKQFSFDAVE